MPTRSRVPAIRLRACFPATAQRLWWCASSACFAATTTKPAGAIADETWRSTLYSENGYDAESANPEIEKVMQDFFSAGDRTGEFPIPGLTGPAFDVPPPAFNTDSIGRMDATEAIPVAITAAGEMCPPGVSSNHHLRLSMANPMMNDQRPTNADEGLGRGGWERLVWREFLS